MRLLILASSKRRLAGYVGFTKALGALKVETNCVHESEYCDLSGFGVLNNIANTKLLKRVLNKIPIPKLFNLIKQFNPDFILTNSTYYKASIAKLVNRPLLVHMRGDPWKELKWNKALYSSLFKRMYTYYLSTIELSDIKKTSLILTNSKWLQKQVKQQLPNHPTQVLYSGVDPEKWRPSPNITLFNFEHPAVIGVFDFNIYLKVLGLLKFIRVIKKMPDVNFYFAGDGPFVNLINRNCPSNLFLIGRVSSFEVKKLLASGDIFVHPSGLDALPRSVMEASLMEKPIIASDVGGIPEIVKNNETGFLSDINDVNQWIRKIRFLLDNPSVGRKFGKNAQEFVMETFDWEKIAKSFLKKLRGFLDQS